MELCKSRDDCPPLENNSQSKKLGVFYKDLLYSIEKKESRICHSGGAADINYMATPQSITLDGLGPIGGNLHTPNEFVLTESLHTRSQGLTRFLIEFEQKNKTLLNIFSEYKKTNP